MRLPDSLRNDFLAVDTVHKAHNNGVFSHNGSNVIQCAPQISVLQCHDQQVRILRFFRCPDRRPVNFSIDAAALSLQPGIPFPGSHDAELNAFLPGKAPDHIGTHGPGTKQCHFLDFHNTILLVFLLSILACFALSRTKMSPHSVSEMRRHRFIYAAFIPFNRTGTSSAKGKCSSPQSRWPTVCRTSNSP